MIHTAKQINHHLLGAKKVVIVPHQNPDGDALGSAAALTDYLVSLGKNPQIFCPAPILKKMQFLPYLERVIYTPAVFEDLSIDTIIVLDSGDLRYAGIDHLIKTHPADIINIDHHHTNERYGKINLVVPTASSTSEIVFNFFKHNHIGLNHKVATALLTGLVSDTDNFSNGATSSEALSIASELIRAGGNLNLINGWTLKNKTPDVLRLWGATLSRLTRHEGLDLAYTYLTREDLIKNNVSESESEGIANYLNNLDGVKISLILKETEDGKIKGSFRTTRDDTDVSALAKKLGGGGHKKAAGFTTGGTIKEVLAKILTEK